MLFEGVTRLSETALKDISLQAQGLLSGVLSACLALVNAELPTHRAYVSYQCERGWYLVS